MRPLPAIMHRRIGLVPQIFRVLLLAMLGAGCGSQTSSSKPPVVDVSGGQTVASSEGTGAPRENAGEVDGPIELIERVVGGSDSDGDRIADAEDRCPDHPEDLDGFEDEDGCPDPDNDRDGVLDRDDRCPNAPETKNGVMDEDGCPDAHSNAAKRAFHDAVTRFAQGDYPGACKRFAEAYGHEPHDAILYNLAVCSEKIGDRKAACDYYRRWRSSAQGTNSPNGVSSLETCP